MEQINEFIKECGSKSISVIVADIESGELLFEHEPDRVFRSASTIKTPMMVYALLECMRGNRSLDERITIGEPLSDSRIFDRHDATSSLWKLLYFMITVSDNTSTNVIIREFGFDTLNAYFRKIGLEKTTLRRRMLDWDAVSNGFENETTNREMLKLYRDLFLGELLDEKHTEYARSILSEQQDKTLVLRYIDHGVEAYHKSGGLDNLVHDCGVFHIGDRYVYIGVFTDGAPDVEAKCAERLCGQIGEYLVDRL